MSFLVFRPWHHHLGHGSFSCSSRLFLLPITKSSTWIDKIDLIKILTHFRIKIRFTFTITNSYLDQISKALRYSTKDVFKIINGKEGDKDFPPVKFLNVFYITNVYTAWKDKRKTIGGNSNEFHISVCVDFLRNNNRKDQMRITKHATMHILYIQACLYFIPSFGFSAALPVLNYWGTGMKKLAGHEVWHLSCKAHTCFQPRCLCKPQLEKDSKGASIGETICTLGWMPDYSFYLWEEFPFWLWMLKLPEDSTLLPQVPYSA